MKCALFIEAGQSQVVLTPENEHEKALMKLVADKNVEWIKRGGFYACRGGWTRECEEETSLILVLK